MRDRARATDRAIARGQINIKGQRTCDRIHNRAIRTAPCNNAREDGFHINRHHRRTGAVNGRREQSGLFRHAFFIAMQDQRTRAGHINQSVLRDKAQHFKIACANCAQNQITRAANGRIDAIDAEISQIDAFVAQQDQRFSFNRGYVFLINRRSCGDVDTLAFQATHTD